MFPEITGLKKNGREIMERFKYDIKWFDRELNRIGSPKRYRFPMKEILDHDYGIVLSMRQDAGKTTTALMYGLLMLIKTLKEFLMSSRR